MADLTLSNSLTHKKEKFIPLTPNEVGIYSCGPTVYWNQHIGHMYAYTHWDVLVRFLRYLGYKVKWVMNITDVGHMTGENEGNPDVGEDKMEKGAKREGVSVWEIATKYINQFEESMELLNIQKPDVMCRATEHIQEQIDLASKIEQNGFSYLTKKGLIFDTSKFSDYAKFASLILKNQKKRADVEDDPEKKLPWDFFLWALNTSHVMKWASPWGVGYPGWHLECTAMSVKYLGDKFDIHTGGVEHIAVHHTNEIAQGYGAFGHSTANYWVHNAHLMAKGGEKMSKSLGNFVTVQELVDKGYDPLALRYLFLTSHYKKGMNFSFEALAAAQKALSNLRAQLAAARSQTSRTALSHEKEQKIGSFRESFESALKDDINVSQALAVLWSALKSNVPSEDKYDLALIFDEVLGLGLRNYDPQQDMIPQDIAKLVQEREVQRKKGDYQVADKLRIQLEEKGYVLDDTSEGPVVRKLRK